MTTIRGRIDPATGVFTSYDQPAKAAVESRPVDPETAAHEARHAAIELRSVKGLAQTTDAQATGQGTLKARFRAEMYALLTDGGDEPGTLEAGTLEDRFDREQARRHQRELRRQCDRMRLEEALGWDADLIDRFLGA